MNEEHDIFGDGVNVAARLEGLAETGGICVSRVVRDQVRYRLGISFEDLGEKQVKNIARPVRAYRALGSRRFSGKGYLPKVCASPTRPRLRCCPLSIERRPYPFRSEIRGSYRSGGSADAR